MVFERLNPDDIPLLFRLMHTYKESIGEAELSEEQYSELNRAILKSEIIFFVAKHDEKLVAMCSVGIIFSTYRCAHTGIFEDFFITEVYRHRGIARGLTSYVFSEMMAIGVVSLWVGSSDVDMELYKSLGFDTHLGSLLTWSSQE